MLVSEIILNSVLPLSPHSNLADLFVEDYPRSTEYIPIVENGSFFGFLPLEDIELDKENHSKVAECEIEKIEQFASPEQHLFEVLVLFQKAGINILPVIGEESVYEGYILLENVVSTISDTFAFQSEGGVLVISVATIDYSLSEISRLVESNQAKILSLIVESDPFTHQRLFVHIKLNEKDLTRVVATLERFNYNVVEVHHTSQSTSLDQERLDMLLKYLGI